MNTLVSRFPWSDGWRAWRDALTTSPEFVRWAIRFPLTRPFARRRARAVFDLAAGFVYSQVLAACVRLDLFRMLSQGPLGIDEVARRTSLPRDSAQRLLQAAASLDLVEARRNGSYGLGALGGALLGQPGIVAMVEHHALFYDDLRDPVALLRAGRAAGLSNYWPYAGAPEPAAVSDAAVRDYSALMSASQGLIVEELLGVHDFGRYRCLLDIGGGDGTFAAAVAARHASLRVKTFDLPAVAQLARQRFAQAGLGDRAEAIGGDFLADPLPQGADAAIFVRVLHDHDDERVRRMLRAARAALPTGGHLLIAEPFADAPGAERVGAAYFAFYLLAMGRGRARTPAELTTMLRDAGFVSVRQVATRMPLQTGLLVAVAGRKQGVN
jgi:demethylspheroidene O-methyltransferase